MYPGDLYPDAVAIGDVLDDGKSEVRSRSGLHSAPALATQVPGWEAGSVTVFRPDGTEAPFSPIYGKGIASPWAASVDGADHVWVSNLTSASTGLVELCGALPA